MKQIGTGVIRAACVSAMLLGAVSTAITLATADQSLAAGGNGNGNGNGNGKGGGNGGDRSEAGNKGGNGGKGGQSNAGGGSKGSGKADRETGTSFSKSDDAPETKGKSFSKEAKSKHVAKGATKKPSKAADILGVHPSDLGALNAANASANALANASEDSRVGKIAAYRDAVLRGQVLETDYEMAALALESLAPPTRDAETIAFERAAELESRALAQDALDRMREELKATEGAGGTDLELAESISDAQADLELQDAEIEKLSKELAATEDYNDAVAELENLEKQLEAQPALETSLLEAAANKPVTPEVEKAVQELLGLN